MLGAGALPLRITPVEDTTPGPFADATTPDDRRERRRNRKRKNKKKNDEEPSEPNIINEED